MVITLDFQSGNEGSIPSRDTKFFRLFLLDELGNWLAQWTVNPPLLGHVGSNPTSSTKGLFRLFCDGEAERYS